VTSTLELLENQQNVFFKIIPSHFSRSSEAQKLTVSKINYEKFGPWKNGYFGALIFEEIGFFGHLKYNFKTS
jgi:hypothetical protein